MSRAALAECARRFEASSPGHHVRHGIDGEPTDLDNLLRLCPDHHRFVHERGWRIEGDPQEEGVFVRPDGRPLARN